ncbi:MAG TPA: hypothetical protein VHC70_13915 [Phycisphaerales bacterium]|nr:hypothetical protein [Phycisphaerales bacterium]
MVNWLVQLDELLRGERVRGEYLLKGRIDLSLRVFVPIAVVLGAIYGFFMGWYALFGWRHGSLEQALATTVKLPALYLLTLGVTFPSLYVFNALVGCRMTFPATIRVLVGAIVVNLAVAASLGPILAFFTLSTTSYAFMVLLNVALLGIAGFVSVGFLLRALRALARSRAYEEAAREVSGAGESAATPPPIPDATPPLSRYAGDPEDPAQAAARARAAAMSAAARRTHESASRREGTANFILTIWVIIYMLVGSQMGWILRPFIGDPSSPFTWLRPREGSFFLAVWNALHHFLGW